MPLRLPSISLRALVFHRMMPIHGLKRVLSDLGQGVIWLFAEILFEQTLHMVAIIIVKVILLARDVSDIHFEVLRLFRNENVDAIDASFVSALLGEGAWRFTLRKGFARLNPQIL